MGLKERIRERLEALDMTPREASLRAKQNTHFLANILSGKTNSPKLATLQKLAPVLKTTVEYLAEGRGADEIRSIPVASYVGAGAEVFPIDGPLDEIEAPPGCEPGAFALIVRGDSMIPAYFSGDVLIAYWVDDPSALLRRRAVVDLANGARLVKQLAPGSQPGRFTLLSHNAEPIFDAEVTRAARIRWHMQA